MAIEPDAAREAAERLVEQLLAAVDEGQDLSGLVLVGRVEPGGLPLIAYEIDADDDEARALVLDTLVSAARAASLPD